MFSNRQLATKSTTGHHSQPSFGLPLSLLFILAVLSLSACTHQTTARHQYDPIDNKATVTSFSPYFVSEFSYQEQPLTITLVGNLQKHMVPGLYSLRQATGYLTPIDYTAETEFFIYYHNSSDKPVTVQLNELVVENAHFRNRYPLLTVEAGETRWWQLGSARMDARPTEWDLTVSYDPYDYQIAHYPMRRLTQSDKESWSVDHKVPDEIRTILGF